MNTRKSNLLLVLVMLALQGFFSGSVLSAEEKSKQAVEASNVEGNNEQFSFVTCPVYRDTDAGPKSGCWLGLERESGNQFDITGALTKPFSDRAVLVEGVSISSGSEMCGATVLEPIRVSVLLDETCPPRIIPAENFPGRKFTLPLKRMQPNSSPRVLPSPPFETTQFDILFNFNSDFLNYQYSEVILEEVSLLIKAAKPKKVVITGAAATEVYLVDGREFKEPQDLARRRAEMVRLALTRLGVPAGILSVKTDLSPVAIAHYQGGLAEETKRRVLIELVIPE
ncbi:hypothetical protein NBRC116493_26760 [Aurantivibrio infirmus]